MANFLRGLGRTLGTAAGTAGAAIGGYQQDQAEAVKRALLAEREKRDADAFSLAQRVGNANLTDLGLAKRVREEQLRESQFQASPEFAADIAKARAGDVAAQARVVARVPSMGTQFTQLERPEDVAKGSYEALNLAFPKHPVALTPYKTGVDYKSVFSQAQAEGAQGAMADRATAAQTAQQASADKKKEDARVRIVQRERASYADNELVKNAYGAAKALVPAQVALTQDTPLGDLMALYAVVKMFDPNSVVKEGEIKLSMDANSLPDKIRLLYLNTTRGRKITPEYRKQIRGLIDETIKTNRDAIAPVQANFGAAARSFELQPGDSATIAPDPFLRGSGTATPGGLDISARIRANRPAAGRP